MVVMVIFINFNILETSKDRPNTPPSLKLLEGFMSKWGSTDPPPDNAVGSKRLRSGRAKGAVIKYWGDRGRG